MPLVADVAGAAFYRRLSYGEVCPRIPDIVMFADSRCGRFLLLKRIQK